MSYTIRPIKKDDLDELIAMIRELAVYEKMLDQCKATREAYEVALFSDDPKAMCLVAKDDDTGRLGCYAIYFYSFSTFEAERGIWLEDIYVRPDFRRQGIGRAMLRELAKICVERGYPRLEWCVLNWNELAHSLYRQVGAAPMEEWSTWRLTGDKLNKLAG